MVFWNSAITVAINIGLRIITRAKGINDEHRNFRAQELCESRGGRPVLPVPKSPYGLCGREAALEKKTVSFRAQELCESRGGRPGLPSLISLRFLWT